MIPNNVINDFADFILARVTEAEKMFKDRKELNEACEAYDKAYQDIFKVLQKADQQDLLKTLTNAQVMQTSWTLKAIYIQATLDMHKLFIDQGK